MSNKKISYKENLLSNMSWYESGKIKGKEEERHRIREKFVEIAIAGKSDKDELKGLYLYTRMLNFLDKL